MSSLNFLLGCLGATFIAGLIAGPFSVDTTSTRPYTFTQAKEFAPAAWLKGGERFPSGAQIQLVTSDGRKPLVPEFSASADAAVSFEGKRILFAGKAKPGDDWQIWETNVNAGSARQVTHCPSGCIKPLYLPGDQIVYSRKTVEGYALESLPLMGGAPLQLTYAPGSYLADDVLQDGRILFESQRTYEGAPVRELMTVYPDGTGVESVRCDHGGDRHSARQLSSHDVLFVEGGHFRRFTSALAGQTSVEQPAGEPGGAAFEVNPGHWLVSLRSGPKKKFAIYDWSAGAAEPRPLQAFAAAHAIDPVSVGPRAVPRRFPSALVPTRIAGNLLCLNIHTTRDKDVPSTAAAVRVYTQDAQHTPQLLGQTTIESDGSFFVQLPAEKPLRLELVDKAGNVVRAEKNWFWMRAAEQRVCVGCHAGPERSPDNAVPAVLLRKDVPVHLPQQAKPGEGTK